MRAWFNDYRIAFTERGRSRRLVCFVGEIARRFVHHLRAADWHCVVDHCLLRWTTLWPFECSRLHRTVFGHRQFDGDVMQSIGIGITRHHFGEIE